MSTNSTAAGVSPIDWLHSVGNFIDNFFEAQCRAAELKADSCNKSAKENNKLQNSVRKVTASAHKPSSVILAI